METGIQREALTDKQALTPYIPHQLELVRVSGMRVTVKMLETMPTPERGSMLLNLEKTLRLETGNPYEVFLEPRGDVNRLRVRLRGVEL